ncbi:MAG: SRPBCC family protein [Planctomycetales bacterium]|nr:SRPBCC family protein [Planctomycetales bacterium]
MPTTGNTVRLHRILRAPAERVYRAFLDPDASARWSPPYGFLGIVHEIDAKVGGRFRMSFKNFGTGTEHTFGGTYLELRENELIRYNDQFDDPSLPGTIEVTVKFTSVSCGTQLDIEQTNLPDAIPVELCYLGWQESLLQLANLVEANIPDGP